MIFSSRRVGALALLIAATLGGTSCSAAAAEPEPVGDHVTVAHGELRGTDDGAVTRFQGVPFAAPPIGPLRWAPPQDAVPWAGTRDATAPGPACAQAPSPAAPTSSEDCLTLGVTSPSGSSRASRLPVLVWIHGGSFSGGAGSDYDPRAMVTEGPVVVVTINYRLGALGFLGLPGLDGSGEFGLLDQQAALRWVRDNVTEFGGDPGNVTIAGESAGADSVCSQLGSPAAVGLPAGSGGTPLFHRAILQSGSCHGVNVTDAILPGVGPAGDTWKPRELVDGAGTALAGSVGCADPSTALDCLRALPADRFTPAVATTYWSPAIGTDTLPRRPSEALAAGDVPDVPLLTGTNVDEGALFGVLFFGAMPLDEAAFTGLLGLAAGDRITEAAAAYPPAGRTPNRAWADVISDRAYACPNLAADEALSAGEPVYAYEFADPGAPSPIAPIPPDLAGGATHASELPYLFDYTLGTTELTPAQQRLATEMRGYWTRFATTGDPNGETATWPRFGADGPLLTLRSDGSTTATATQFGAEHRCSLWA